MHDSRWSVLSVINILLPGLVGCAAAQESPRATEPPAIATGWIEANGTDLYYELRGRGTPVLFISGATGDAGHFAAVADLLADEFTVVTYDRRGNSRSPQPDGWTTTSTTEQADDAAALLVALGLTPATVVGSSGGAIIALDLVVRHPNLLRGAILHEPPMLSVLADPDAVMGTLQPMIEDAMATGGPPAAVEAFVRTVTSDTVFEQLDPELRARMVGNGETLFGIEFGRFEDYRPDDATLAAIQLPVQVVAGTESAPFFTEAAEWLADRIDVELATLPGGHAPYMDRPQLVADTIRPFLQQMSER